MTTTATTTPVPTPSAPAQPRLVAVGAAVVLGTILSILDATIVNVATRTLGHHFQTSISTVQWVLTGYLLGFAAAIPVAGWASRRHGSRRVWIAALLVFLAGSALAGSAWSIGSLVAFRVLQGVGGGLLLPVGQAIVAQAAGPERMGRVMGLISLPMMVGSVAGPVVGGLIVSATTWRWVFFINLPIGAVAVALALRVLPHDRPQGAAPLDVRGLLLMSGGVAAFVYGMSEAGAHGGFGSARTLGWLGAGAALIALYVLHAIARGDRALLDLALFRRRGFAAAVTTNFVVAVALFGMLVLLPLYWQIVRGESPLRTGLLLVPQAIGAAAAMPLAGRLTDRLGAGVVVPVGIVLGIVGAAVYTQVGADRPDWLLSAALFVTGLGLGATIMPSMAAAYQALPRELMPAGTSALNTVQRLGASIGTAVLAVVLQRAITDRVPQLGAAALGQLPPERRTGFAPALAHAFGTTFWVTCALTALSLLPALLLPRSAGRKAG